MTSLFRIETTTGIRFLTLDEKTLTEIKKEYQNQKVNINRIETNKTYDKKVVQF